MTDCLIEAESMEAITSRVTEQFTRQWKTTPTIVAVAPGRVNVIGEHVDYNGGWVLPAAIERYMVMAVRPRTDETVRLASADFDEVVEFEIADITPEGPKDWGRYVRGVIAGMIRAGYSPSGFDAFVSSTIPVGGGLSSSAALESATGLALLAMCNVSMDRFSLAKLCQKAEHEYAGVPCGIMDQAAILNCKRDHMLFLDCEKESFEQAVFDAPDWRLMIINSGVAHELADGEYALRRKACHRAADKLGVLSLRHIDVDGLDEILENLSLDEEMVKCVRHNVTENDRTRKTVTALAKGDIALAGQLLNASHASLRDDYRVSCRELDVIAATAQKLKGVAGCRMTGGGFGGSCIALVRKDFAGEIANAIDAKFFEEFGHRPSIFLTAPERGAFVEKIG